VLIFVFSLEYEWLPVQGYVSPRENLGEFFSHMILPAIALGLVYMALIARITRASVLEVLSQDYIRTARAKGLAEDKVLLEERGGADRHHHRHRCRPADRRRRGH